MSKTMTRLREHGAVVTEEEVAPVRQLLWISEFESSATPAMIGRTPLHLAMSCAPPEMVDKLLLARAAVDATTPAGGRLRVIALQGQGRF
eukprot:Skav207919  [mRNA]  locus=scaffold190:427370:432625:- [translate_table: standard]